jgi:2-amino-4-hydroxy-6-hydroxymethyldihydropteridine diphosphokinase
MEKVILALGSSSGDRLKHLREAESFCRTHMAAGTSALLRSAIYESEPLGSAKNAFLNACLSLESTLSPDEILMLIKEHEQSAGRDPEAPRWSDRPIDIDIIGYGQRTSHTSQLEIPHPEYSKRLFVLLPMQDVCPGWTDPVSGLSLAVLIESAPVLRVYNSGLKW